MLRWLVILLVFLSFCWGLGAIVVRSNMNVSAISQFVHSLRLWGIAVQSLLVALIMVRWNAIVAWARRRGIVKPHEHDQVLALRRRVFLFLLAYLVLIPIGPTTLFRLLAG